MRRLKTGAIAFLAGTLLSLGLPGTDALADALPNADAVIEKYLEATGGRPAHESIRSRVSKGTFTITGMDSGGTVEVYQSPPNALSRIATDFGPLATGVLDEGAWTMSPFEGGRILGPAAELDANRRTSLNEFLDWKRWFERAESVGEETVEDTSCYAVQMTPAEGEPTTHYFAKDTGLLAKSVTGRQSIYFSDYRQAGGVLLAHRQRLEAGPATFEITFATIVNNLEIPVDAFEIPGRILALARGDDEGSETK